MIQIASSLICIKLEYLYIQYDPMIYTNNCTRNFDRVYAKLDKYIRDPTADNIHHMRTSLRRLEATYQSSLKEILKKKNVKAFAKGGKKLFRINSRVRDIDIILEKLANEGKMTDLEQELIESLLKQEKDDKLEEAKVAALDLKKIIVSNIYGPNILSKKFKNKSRKRILKIVKKLKTRIESKLPMVISDKSKVSELHEIRKDTKKLRYVIELVLSSKETREKDGGAVAINVTNQYNKNDNQVLTYLEKIQQMLGDIHDYDITLEYLKKKKQRLDELAVTNIITNIQNIRNTKFDQFVTYVRSLTIMIDSTN